MSEAIILYRGRGGVDPERLKPTTITSNGIYEAPVTGTYRVSCVGGGGGGGGGCRNSWNSSQVFYGSAGSRGSLTTTNVTLNAGDKIQVNLGAGGAGGTNNTTVVSNNSRGTNGSAGGTTTFGSLVSGAGGTYGQWSWHYHYWYNYIQSSGESMKTISGWAFGIEEGVLCSHSVSLWGTTYPWSPNHNGNFSHPTYKNTILFNSSMNNYGTLSYYYRPYYINNNEVPGYGAYLYNANIYDIFRRCVGGKDYNTSNNVFQVCKWNSIENSITSNKQQVIFWGIYDHRMIFTNSLENQTKWCQKYGLNLNFGSNIWWHGLTDFYYNGNGERDWNALTSITVNVYNVIWNNRIQNVTSNCYTSIQQGSWWYISTNNVTTSGTRTYRGDGGSSGQAGNAGFVLVIPPTT